MKKFIFVFVLLLISVRFYAQAPEKVNYQAVARNLAGAPLINQTINVKYEIRQGSTTGVVVYAENHVITTNQFGLFTAEIGGGTVITGSFPGIAWGTSPFYLFVEVDGDPMGVTQLLSVPYALYAKESGNGPAGLPGKNSLSVSSAYSGPMCSANGGSQIDVGLDDNNDGILQPIEIDFTYYVCNGTDGVIGSNGLNTLSSTVASTSCTNGGVTVNMGLDANNNNILEASEISVSYDVCNGVDGIAGTNGTDGLNLLAETIPSTSCPNGGVTVNMGQDINNNGILETGEITTTYDVCNGVDGTSGTTYFAGNGISLSGDTITNIGDADADPTNELQNLSISNDTLYISGGNQVIIPGLTETTTTLIDNGNGTFTYTDETGTPITFDANIDDADADASNELQVLSISNDTIFLSNGGFVQLPPAVGDNWGSQTVNVDGTTITGDGVVTPLSGFDGQYSSLTGTPIDNDTSATNELQVLTISNDTIFLSNGGFVQLPAAVGDNWGSQTVNVDGTTITGDGVVTPLSGFDGQYSSLTGTPIDNDTSATNEIQVLSISNDTIFLSNGGFVQLPAAAGDNWGSQTVNVDGTTITGDGVVTPLSGFDGQYSSLTGTPIDNDTSATNELQVLSFSNDTLYLSNGNSVYIMPDAGDNWGSQTVNVDGTTITGDGVVTPLSGFDGQYSSLTGAPTNVSTFTNDAGYITNPDDADADASNELQVLSFSNDTLYLSNGNSVYITPGAGDNWGSQTVNVDGTTITGDGVVTPLSGFDGQYSSLTGTPIDNDTSATNELQVLSISNDTLFLTNGGFVQLPAAAGDNWGSQTVNVDGTTITGDGVVTPLSGFDGQYSSLTGAPTNVSTFTNDAGYITNPDDADADASNELQVLSFSNDTLYLSNGNSVYITPGAGDNWGSQTVNVDGTTITGDGVVTPLSGFDGQYSSLMGAPTNVSTFTNDAGYITNPDDADADATNELQVLTISNDTIFLTNGGFVQLPAAAGDNWGSQTVNVDGTTITGDGVVTPLSGFDGQYSSLTGAPTNVSTFTNDAGYITNPDDADADATNELQVLTISNDTIFLTNGGFVQLPAAAGDNWGSQTVNVDGTTITGDGVVTPLSGFDGQYSSLTGAPTNVSTFTNDAGYITNPDDADADATNELQNLSLSGTDLTISGGNTVDLSGLTGTTYTAGTGIDITGNIISNTGDLDNDPNNELELPMIGNTNGDVLVWNGSNWVAGTDQTADGDTDPNNELELPTSATTGEVLMWNGSNWAAGTDQTADGDTDATNELELPMIGNTLGDVLVWNGTNWVNQAPTVGSDNQDLDLSGNTLSLTNDATPVDLSPYLDNTDNQTLTATPSPGSILLDISGGNSVVLGIDDADANPTNELITSFGLNGTADSLVITEAGNNWAVPLSSLSASANAWSLTGNAGTGVTNFIGTTDAQDLRFRTNNTEKMVITQSGNVGMGVAAPLAHLHISRDGNAVAGIMSAGGYGELTLLRSNGTKASPSHVLTNDQIGTLDFVGYNSVQGWTGGLAASIEVFATEDYSASGFKGSKMAFNVSQNGGAGTLQAMTIDNFGRIGIGVTSPLQLVDIEGGENSGIDLTTGAIKLRSSVNSIAGAQFGTVSSHSLDFITSNNSRIRIASSGEVGVGTTSPTAVLHLEGSLRLNNLSGNAPIAGYILTSMDAQGNAEWTDPSLLTISSPWTKTSNYVYPTTLSDSIGIGTNSPAQKLHVADGQILNNWSNPNGDANLVIRNWNSGSGPGYNTGTLGQVTIATSDAAENKYAIQGYSGGDGGSKYGFYGSATGTGGQNYGGYFSALQGTNNTGVSSIAYADFTSNSNAYGLYTTAQGDGAGTTYGIYAQNASTVTGNTYAGYFQNLNSTGSTIYGVRTDVTGNLGIGEKYGINSSVTGSALRNYAGYFSASGATNNWAGYFAQGNVFIQNTLVLPTGAVNNYILKTDATGNASWADPSTLGLGGPWTKSGNDIYPTNFATENVAIGTNAPGAKLHVQDNLATNGPLFRIKNVNLSFPSTMAFTSGNDTYNYIMGVDPNDNSFKISNSLVNLNAANRLTISSAGDVGIGTTAPKSKLNVNGDVGLNDGSTVASNNSITILLTNSGPAVNAGDIVVVGTANNSFNVTNNPGNYSVIGVVTENIGAGAVGKIAISGVVTVNIESASNVLRGQHCITGSNNGRASGVSIPSAGTSIGVYLTDGPADGTAKVLLR